MAAVVIYLLLSLLVGVLGKDRRPFGLWGFFFFSLVTTPLVGAFALLLAGPGQPQR